MSKDEVLTGVVAALVRMTGDESLVRTLTRDSQLREPHLLDDSLDEQEFMITIEDLFDGNGISVSAEDMADWQTVGDVADWLESRVN